MPKRRVSAGRRFLGTFGLGDAEPIVGDLRLRGQATALKLHADKPMGMADRYAAVYGHAYTGEHLTLVNCLSTYTGSVGRPGGPQRYSASIIPALVAVGHRHFSPQAPTIRGICFSTTDLHTLFYDFHAFGMIHDSRGALSRIIKELGEDRAKEVGEQPMIGYFTGRSRIIEAATHLGKICVSHSIRHNFGGPSGVIMKNRTVVRIEPEASVTCDAAITAMTDLALFLSIAAGRAQGISRIYIEVPAEEGRNDWLQVHMTFPWKNKSASDTYRPHPGDVPLQPIKNPDEFRQVLANWIANQGDSRIARHRYLACLRGGNLYTAERLITAANMFDLLPNASFPAERKLSPDLTKIRDECAAKFRALPDGPERSSALSALGRLGTPFLVKKVLHRVAMIERRLGGRFPDLTWVVTIAVKCRNVYVHGISNDFDFEKAEPFVPFLTEALEFIFGASDLIEAGWTASNWLTQGSAGGHSFARFRESYLSTLGQLKGALQG